MEFLDISKSLIEVHRETDLITRLLNILLHELYELNNDRANMIAEQSV